MNQNSERLTLPFLAPSPEEILLREKSRVQRMGFAVRIGQDDLLRARGESGRDKGKRVHIREGNSRGLAPDGQAYSGLETAATNRHHGAARRRTSCGNYLPMHSGTSASRTGRRKIGSRVFEDCLQPSLKERKSSLSPALPPTPFPLSLTQVPTNASVRLVGLLLAIDLPS